MRSLRRAVRTLMRTPFVTAVAVLSLALGTGANAAIFSMFDAILFEALPVRAPAGLVNLSAPGPKPGSQSSNMSGGGDHIFSYPMFRDLEREQTVFTGIAGHRLFSANFAHGGQTASGRGTLVSGTYFPVLGLQPALGRLFTPEDDRIPGGHPVVVLSFDYWRVKFDESPAMLNDTLIVNGQAMTVVGVAPRGFQGTTLGEQPQVFVPLAMSATMRGREDLDNRRSYWVYLFARLAPDLSTDAARTGINVPYTAMINDIELPLQQGMSDQTRARFVDKQIDLVPGSRGQSELQREATAPLLLLLGVTGVVLLLACVNIANLLLAKTAERAGEMAVRLSMGATRGQLIRQLLTESWLLAGIGGLGGLLVANWTLDVIVAMLPAEATAVVAFELDATMLLFTAALALGTGLVFGLLPALHSTRPDLASTLKGQTGRSTGGRTAARFRTGLATAQIGLSMALLVLAGLFTRSLINVSQIELGIRPDNLVTFGVFPGLNGYTPERSLALFTELEEELAALPGVVGVTASTVPVLAGSNRGRSVTVQGYDPGPDTNTGSSTNSVGPGYFGTMGIPLVAGREFTRQDTADTPKVAVVNEAFARRFELGRDAVGMRMRVGGSPGGANNELDIEIVGLVQDAKYSDVKREVPAQYFVPYRQDGAEFISFYVRTESDPEALLSVVPRVVTSLDANLPVEQPRTMLDQVRENVAVDRLIGTLSTAFALLATLLAAVGLYGVLAYGVTQRTREIGLRMALGADSSSVRRMILGQVGRMTVVGGSAGLVLALGAGRLARSLLFELQGHDPLAIAGAVVALCAVALSAGLIPAVRASRIEPMRALRYE